MYDSYLIIGEEFKNVVQDGDCIGLGMCLCYYRGIVLSLSS